MRSEIVVEHNSYEYVIEIDVVGMAGLCSGLIIANPTFVNPRESPPGEIKNIKQFNKKVWSRLLCLIRDRHGCNNYLLCSDADNDDVDYENGRGDRTDPDIMSIEKIAEAGGFEVVHRYVSARTNKNITVYQKEIANHPDLGDWEL